MDIIFWGALLRLVQAILLAAPTILVGLMVTAVFRTLLGHEGTRKLFGHGSNRALFQAWLMGMLLPVCSLGVIPIVRELRRAGLSGGTILAFALTAPLFNPLSVLYGLTLSSPVVIVTFSLCSLLIVTLAGWGWDKMFSGTAAPEPEPPRIAPGYKRILGVMTTTAKELISSSGIYMLMGLLGVASLSILLPAGYLQSAAEADDPFAPLFMGMVMVPAYANPMTAMIQLSAMFEHGNSVGASFALLALGSGVNLGLLVWMLWTYGTRRAVVWMAMLFTMVVAISYGVDRPLYPQGVEPAGHTHAFDGYCSPFPPGTPSPPSAFRSTLVQKTEIFELVPLGLLGVIFCAGLLLITLDRKSRIDAWLLVTRAKSQARLDVELSPKVVGAVAIAGLILLSFLGVYVYYPEPEFVFEELSVANTHVGSAALSQDWERAERWIPVYDDWTRKLEVSHFLRGKNLSRYQQAKLAVLRDKLEVLKHECEAQEAEEAKDMGMDVTRAYRRLRAAFGL
ncbi:MAG: permease [Pirellulales bacterium]|nr:permease [Pirellulales bacterium]